VRALGGGDRERESILEAMRVTVEKDLGQPVQLDAFMVNLAPPYAAVRAFAVRPDGEDVDYSGIPKYAQMVAAGMFDPGIDGLLRKTDGTWAVVVWEVGPTDVRTEPWVERYGVPEELFLAPEE